MSNRSKMLTMVSVMALAMLHSANALAAGTAAGTSITNTASIAYQVGGVSQNTVTASNTITVDRKVNVTIARVGSSATSVSPGQTSAVTTFTVTNLSNATLDFGLAVAQQSGSTGAYGATDNFDTSNVKIYVDSNANGTYDSGTDTQVTYLDELAADANKTVFVVSDIPLGRLNGDDATIVLTSTGFEGGGSGSKGAALTETSGANTSAMDTVFADGAGATDSARDAAYSIKNDYLVFTATLSVTKISKVISDPLNGTTNPKAIPGATVEYCIVVANASGSAPADSVDITDPLPSQIAYDATYGIFFSGTYSAGVCNSDGIAGGSYATGSVTVTLSGVAANETKTVLYRATIN
ncbi:hypothetical protein [Aquisediminimonas sediminicola]|uniref:hypothetical protein n=1 Tax=Alteraquisediminimonas sediminicola TaxID=2676787 RepID=UPI001C8E0E0D|nr:hypothetical protein [Aquisediminimonas sediminicola]